MSLFSLLNLKLRSLIIFIQPEVAEQSDVNSVQHFEIEYFLDHV